LGYSNGEITNSSYLVGNLPETVTVHACAC